MEAIITSAIAAFSGASVAVAVVAFLLKQWIGTRIEESVRHEHSRRLEEHKAELQKELNRYLQQLDEERQSHGAEREADKLLFEKFLGVLPPGGYSITLVRESSLGAAFWRFHLDEMREFYHVWKTQDYEFLDTELERRKIALYQSTSKFMGHLGTHSFSVGPKAEYQAIYPELKDSDSVTWKKAVDEAERLAQSVFEDYDEFVRFGRKLLKL